MNCLLENVLQLYKSMQYINKFLHVVSHKYRHISLCILFYKQNLEQTHTIIKHTTYSKQAQPQNIHNCLVEFKIHDNSKLIILKHLFGMMWRTVKIHGKEREGWGYGIHTLRITHKHTQWNNTHIHKQTQFCCYWEFLGRRGAKLCTFWRIVLSSITDFTKSSTIWKSIFPLFLCVDKYSLFKKLAHSFVKFLWW